MKVQTRSIGASQEKRTFLTKAITVVMFRMSHFITFLHSYLLRRTDGGIVQLVILTQPIKLVH